MNRPRTVTAAIALQLTCIVAMLTAGATASPGGRTAAHPVGAATRVTDVPGEAANRRAAALDGQQLLAGLVLPAGAVAWQQEPPGGGFTLSIRGQGQGIASPDVTHRYRWWVVPGAPQAAAAFVSTHVPSGSSLESSGSGSLRGVTTSWSVMFGWPAVRSVLFARELSVTFVRLPGGSTGVGADAADMWDRPRPAGERIPSSARLLEIAVGKAGKRPSLTRTVTSAREIAKITAMINGLMTVQPVAISCPAFPSDGPYVTFTFLRTAAGPPIAQTSESIWFTDQDGDCEAMNITIAGRARTALLGGASVVRRTGALLHVKL